MSHINQDFPQFYLTAPSPCPYLPGHQERKVFTHLDGPGAGALNDALSVVGFRRSQNIAYRPACETCSACVSVRVVLKDFRPSRSMRRVLARNRDLRVQLVDPQITDEHYALFNTYVKSRHSGGGMSDMSSVEFAQMVEQTHVGTRLVEYRLPNLSGNAPGRLIATSLTDTLADGLSMIYSYYDSAERARGLGTYMVLEHLARGAQMGLPYVYLGYLVAASPKMAYKARFLPQERLIGQVWRLFNQDGEQPQSAPAPDYQLLEY
ncbi:MAG: arginyltransferase [Alphaproteobacteria bacterium]